MNNAINQIKSMMNEFLAQNDHNKGEVFFAALSQKWVLNVLVLTQTCHRLDPNARTVTEDSVPALQEMLLGVLKAPSAILLQMVNLINANLSTDQQSPEIKAAIAYVNEELPSYDDRTLGNVEATVKAYFLSEVVA